MRRAFLAFLLAICTKDVNAQGDTLRRASVRTFAAVEASVGHPYQDEFETTAAFQQRLRARFDTSAVVIEIDPSALSVKYDADRAGFSVKPVMREVDVGAPVMTAYVAITTREINAVSGTHSASNGFGATAVVVDRISDRWTVASTIPDIGSTGRGEAWLPAAPAAARSLKAALRYFVSGHLAVGPGSGASELLLDVDSATFSSPIQTKIVTHVLWMDAPELQVVDARTHRILARVGF